MAIKEITEYKVHGFRIITNKLLDDSKLNPDNKSVKGAAGLSVEVLEPVGPI
jgi:hypothetical protein